MATISSRLHRLDIKTESADEHIGAPFELRDLVLTTCHRVRECGLRQLACVAKKPGREAQRCASQLGYRWLPLRLE